MSRRPRRTPSWFSKKFASRADRRRQFKSNLRMEQLEDRRLLAVSAVDDPTGGFPNAAYTTDEDTSLTVPDGPDDILANDSGSGPLTIVAADSASSSGAAVTVNPDGSFTYDPTGSATLQALNNGDTVTDTFTYTITDTGPQSLVTSATLTAYYPLNDGAAGTPVTGADDVIDDPTHPAQDATTEGSGGMWVNDPTRGIVYSTVQGERLNLGTQGIDLASEGFTWSLWVKLDPLASGNSDAGADVIIGSRNGIWNKLQPTGLQRWAVIDGYNLADNQWHHVALVGTADPGAEVTLYIDGTPFDSDDTFFNNVLAVNDKFELGGSSNFSEDIEGLISDVSIWKGALTPAEIQELAGQTATA